jgi:TPR repeat protein
MKKILLSIILISVCLGVHAASFPTRNQLLQLYHQASVAKKQNNFELAIEKYAEIIKLVPQLPEPYLYIAEMYDANSAGGKVEDIEMAIFFYRKYIDTQLDDTKIVQAQARLRQLEAEINVSHFDDYLKKDAVEVKMKFSDLETDNTNEEPEFETVSKIESLPDGSFSIVRPGVDNVIVKSQLSINESNLPETTKEPVVILNSTSNKRQLLYPLEINPMRAMKNIWEPVKITPNSLSGRWVSSSRMPNNREAWILDIDCQYGETTITLNPNSGVMSLPLWEKNLFNKMFERKSMLNIAEKSSIITSSDDISSETMRMMSDISLRSVSGTFKNDTLKFKYDIDLKYDAVKGKYDWLRSCGAGLSTLLSTFGTSGAFLGGIVNKLAIGIAEKAELKDTPIKYNAEIGFKLLNTQDGMVGLGTELLIEAVDKTSIEKKNRRFKTVFYKVKDDYAGYNVVEYDEKSSFELENERTLMNVVKKDAKNNVSSMCLLAMLYDYSIGEKKIKDNVEKTYKQMLKAAKAGSIDAAAYVIKASYDMSLDDERSKAERKKSLEVAEEWSKKLSETSPAIVKCAQAKYAIDSKCDYDRAMALYKDAAELMENGYIYNKLGELCIEAYGDTDSAIGYFNDAIELGDNDAMRNMARLYRDGLGFNQDVEEYILWTVKAYENGNIEAINDLADIYFKGIGVEQSYSKGIKYAEVYTTQKQNQWKVYVEKLCPQFLYIVK